MVVPVKQKVAGGQVDEFGAKALNVYWSDSETYCLSEAPNAEAVHKAHEAIGVKLGGAVTSNRCRAPLKLTAGPLTRTIGSLRTAPPEASVGFASPFSSPGSVLTPSTWARSTPDISKRVDMAEKERPAPPELAVPLIARWFASGYLNRTNTYRQELEAYADYLEGELEQLGWYDKPDLNVEERDSHWIDGALRTLPGFGSGVLRIYLDNKYWVCSETDFNRVVAPDPTDEKRYAADRFDCDNFSFTFKARIGRQFGINAVGVVIDSSSEHAYNLVVFLDGTAKIFEPQSDEWPDLGSDYYKFESGLVLI